MLFHNLKQLINPSEWEKIKIRSVPKNVKGFFKNPKQGPLAKQKKSIENRHSDLKNLRLILSPRLLLRMRNSLDQSGIKTYTMQRNH